MKPSKTTIALCSAAAAIGVLAWHATDVTTSPPGGELCTVGVGVGMVRGTVVEPCGACHSGAFSSMPVLSRTQTQTPPRSLHQELMVEISLLNTHRILTINALRLMIT